METVAKIYIIFVNLVGGKKITSIFSLECVELNSSWKLVIVRIC